MLAPFMIANQYPYQLILGPALIIILAVLLALLVKYPSSKTAIGGAMIFLGAGEVMATLPVAFLWGFFIAVSTLIMGSAIIGFKIAVKANYHFSRIKTAAIFMLAGAVGVIVAMPVGSFFVFIIGLGLLVSGAVVGASALQPWSKMRINQRKTGLLKKSIFVVLAAAIALSASLIAIRATTNIIHEQRLENYNGGNTPNLTLRGVLAGILLNYEVNTGYSYHIFPAYITLNVTELVWDGSWLNQTVTSEYWQHQQIVIYFEKTDIPKITVGQPIEVSGYLYPWLEDSLYSGKLVVSAQINGSYLKLV
jgi:hypothetical protein